MEYLEQARKYVEDRFGADVDEMTKEVLDRWESVLHRPRRGPDAAVQRARLGRQAGTAGGLPHPRRPRLVPPAAAARRPAVLRHPARPRPVQPPRRPRPDAARHRRTPRSRPPSRTRRRTPGPTSAAVACASTPTRWPRPPGTRSSSTSPAASPCSAFRPWSRCAAPRPTWARLLDRCRTAAGPGDRPDRGVTTRTVSLVTFGPGGGTLFQVTGDICDQCIVVTGMTVSQRWLRAITPS